MGNHRAERGRTRPTPGTRTDRQYVGRRVAGREATQEIQLPAAPVERKVRGIDPATDTGTFHFTDLDVTAELPLVRTEPGKRRAARHDTKRPVRGLPGAPVLVGLATLAIAVGGALTAQGQDASDAAAASAGEPSITGTVSEARGTSLSRGTGEGRDLAQDALVQAAEEQSGQRSQLLGKLAKQAEKQAQVIEDNLWVLPLRPSIITGTFGATSIWSSGHSGLDLNGETGDPIHAIASGVVTYTGYAGNCGNRTEVLLPDGTSLVYCHQSEILVQTGDTVTRDQVIGLVGTTGRSTGSHLHVEVHTPAGELVDPYQALVDHGVTP